ncbi:ATPase (AAA) domain protein [Metarhizium robertsii]|uniref:26S protease regulatory subunit 6A n=2 Tax=Metarhizium robertsii TaxID=568076 RepID=E9EKZ2_METRA|nr:26S protease regulatory subunit 6A [Metarhizium robertsii ARSEF 23]EFZ04383.1 26S protease regulatory subunit 6A [Metarhizium robertsii ARSEF 23]EXV00161.1 ATPase (AAA) domain protein [Metarhizium robertsii]
MQVKSHSIEFRDIPRDRADTSVRDKPVVTFKEDVSFAKDNAAYRKDGAKGNSEENNGAVPASKKPEIKTLYIETTLGETLWFEDESRYSVRKIEVEDVKKFAVIHIRYIADGLQSHSIVIQSPRLQKALKPVFQYDPEIDSTPPTLQIMPPFDCFIHGLEQLKDVKDEEAHPETKAYMGLLYNMMEEQLKKSVKTREHCLKTRTVAFADLWTIYSPGCGVLYRGRDDNPVGGRQPGYCGHLEAFQVIRGSYKPTKDDKLLYVLKCRFIGMWHGLAWYQAEFEIPQYKGHKEFASLPLPPLEGHERQLEFTKLLCGRGQKFVNLVTSSSACRKDYEIAAPSWPQCDCRRGEIGVKGRIMLGRKHRENNGLYYGGYKFLQGLQANQDDVVTSPSSSSESSSTQVLPTLTQDQLMYASPVIHVWSYPKQVWMDLLVDVVRDVQFNTQPLKSVMLPEAAHASIQTFLTCMAAREYPDQAIHLVGGPGTGKTCTAKAIAKVCQKNLHTLSAGTLGIGPSRADRILRELFDRARTANAWVFIKSSDEFLRKPTISDPKAWKLQSTFRRHVNDFKGLVFFSSDRIQDLDPDLQGRISLQIDFPALGPEQREQLWTSSLKESAFHFGLRRHRNPTKDEMDQLSHIDLNGKQIENAKKKWISSASHAGLQLKNLISIASEMQNVGRGCRPAHEWIDDDGYGSGSDENQMDDWAR